MRYEQILATLIIALLAGTIGAYLVSAGHEIKTTPQGALTQILQTGQLRCGYIEQAGALSKDANGAVRGLWPSLMTAFGAQAGLDIVWAAATTEANLVADLKAGKFDALCTGLTPTGILAKNLAFTHPVFYRAALKDTAAPQSLATLNTELPLREMLDTGLGELRMRGDVDHVLQQGGDAAGFYYRAHRGYDAPR